MVKKSMTNKTIFFKRLDTSGTEFLQMNESVSACSLAGMATFQEEGEAYAVQYDIVCTTDWRTQLVSARCVTAQGETTLKLRVDQDGTWWANGVSLRGLSGCTNVDLGFTPASNTLPIRRLQLAVGDAAEVEVAWVKFPSFEIVRARQVYRRVSDGTYLYLNVDSGFSAEISVDEHGLVTHYPGLWQAIA